MKPEFQFDIERLLSPLSADRPAGEDLRYHGTYERVKQARHEDNPNLPQGQWKTELRKADWKVVESICAETLETRSKDLQIAAWLTEAWLYLHGFAGATKGFELMRALCESFWDHLYPGIKDGDLEFRLAPLEWLNRRLSIVLKLQPITEPDAPGEHSYNWADHENAALEDNAALKAGPAKPGAPASKSSHIQRSVMLTPTAHFQWLLADLRGMLKARERLEELVDAKAGKAAPGLMRVSAVAEAIAAFLESVLAQRNDLVEDEETIAGLPDEFNGDAPDVPLERLPIPGRIRDRADAYYLLAEAAEFLARTEPHSPTPYLIRRAIAWGSMSLDELLPELVRNSSELAEIFRLLQIR